jgi:hypothetical protein
VWSAQAHVQRGEPLPQGWRDRWEADAARIGQVPLPERLLDPPEEGGFREATVSGTNRHTLESIADLLGLTD